MEHRNLTEQEIERLKPNADHVEQAWEIYNECKAALPDAVEIDKEVIKRCALVVCDNVLNFNRKLIFTKGSLAHDYWLKVKKAVQNL